MDFSVAEDQLIKAIPESGLNNLVELNLSYGVII
jgi:hypothetical protein